MNKILLITLLMNFSILAKSKEQDKEQESKRQINCLLNLIEKSDATFIRNGSNHSGLAAKMHLLYKYKQATKSSWPFYKKSKVSPETFINKIASKSSFSGKAYKIKFGDKVFTTKNWLLKQLNKSCRSQS